MEPMNMDDITGGAVLDIFERYLTEDGKVNMPMVDSEISYETLPKFPGSLTGVDFDGQTWETIGGSDSIVAVDISGSGEADIFGVDLDGDGVADIAARRLDTDGDGVFDTFGIDYDQDGRFDDFKGMM